MWVRGGSDAESYGAKCYAVSQVAAAAASSSLDTYAQEIESGSCVADFGAKCDAICNTALETFASKAKGDAEEKTYGEQVEALEKSVDAPMRVLYMKQLLLLRDRALAQYKSASKNSESSDYEAMIAADAFFAAEAAASSRSSSSSVGAWDFAAERTSLQSTMNEIARSKKRLADTKLGAAKSQNEIMKVLQMQHGQIQQLQQVAYGQASPLNLGLAYRVPDTNINLSLGHQQGRTNIQLSCVPDESAPMLGPNGFTRGVGPGNLGVSVNLNV